MPINTNIPNDLVPLATTPDVPADLRPMPKFSVGSAQFVGEDQPQKPQLASIDQLSPDQKQQFFQELQPTPVNANPHIPTMMESVGGALARSPVGGLEKGMLRSLADATGNEGFTRQAQDMQLLGESTQQGTTGGNAAAGATGLGTGAALTAIPGGPALAGGGAFLNRLSGEATHEELGTAPVDPDYVSKGLKEGALEFGFQQAMQSGLTAGPTAAATDALRPAIGAAAPVVARTAVGGALGAGYQGAANLVDDRPVTDNMLNAAGQGGLMEVGAGALHSLLAPKAAPATEATPAASPETPPQSTGAAPGTPERLAQIADTSAPVTQRTGLDSLLGKAQSLLADESGGANYDFLKDKRKAFPVTAVFPDGLVHTDEIKGLNEGHALSEAKKNWEGAEVISPRKVYNPLEKFLGNEEGGAKVPDALKTFGERVVKPGVQSLLKATKTTAENVSRFLGTGLEEGPKEKEIGQNLRESMAQQDLDRTRLEEQFKPARETIGAMDDAAKTATMDDIEKGENPTGDKDIQQLIDTNREVNAKNKDEAENYGISTDTWDSNDDWVGRMAEFPDRPKGGGSSSIAGSEAYLKGRKFDTFSDFKDAVEAAGGKVKYDNPVDMMLAKHAEVRKSIEARKLVSDAMTDGTITKLKTGDPLPPGKQFLDDRLARKMAGKNQMWVDPETGKPAMKPAPRLIADAGVANKLNQFIAPGIGKTLPIWDHLIDLKRQSVGLNFALSAWHAPVVTVGSAGMAVGQALDNALHGEWGLAKKNLLRANPVTMIKEGSAIRQQAANPGFDPSLEPFVGASVKGGQRFNLRSVLNPTALEKAKIAYNEGDPISATGRYMQAFGDKVSSPIMDRMVPNLKQGAMKMYAETLMSRGLKGEELDTALSKAGDNVDNVLGQVVRKNQFQHKVVSDLMDGIFSAPKFAEGALRMGGAAVRDTVEALSGMRKGRVPTITPAMQTVAGLTLTTALMGAITQVAYTTAVNGKPTLPETPKDYFFPRTGKKNADGTDERVSLPNPAAIFSSAATEGPGKAIANRVAPIWRSIWDVAQNADYKNVKVREGEPGEQVLQSAKHIAKSQVPFSMQNLVETPAGPPQTMGERALGVLGIKRAPSSVMHSDAENALYDLTPHDTRTQEQAAKADTKNSLLSKFRTNRAEGFTATRDAVRSGKLSNDEAGKVQDEAAAPRSFQERLVKSSLPPSDLMTVWGKMTADEKSQYAWVMRRKLNDTTQIDAPTARKYLKQISEDLKP